MTTVSEYARLVAKIAVLKEIAEEYPGKTIENIITQMEARRKEQFKQAEKVTAYEPKQEQKPADSPILKQFRDLKKKHPDALLLFRCGDFYETYKDDAEKAAKVLGITLTKSSKQKEESRDWLRMAGFPYHALDTYLPKLIRAGIRVAICDQIETPKQTVKRGITELVQPRKEV